MYGTIGAFFNMTLMLQRAVLDIGQVRRIMGHCLKVLMRATSDRDGAF
jgi:hypothetical protein